MIRLALYQPDIPQNTGTILRLGACLGAPVDIIEPAGFPWSDRAFRRAGMDYLDHVEIARHDSFGAFLKVLRSEDRRLVLLTTRATLPYTEHRFGETDTLLRTLSAGRLTDLTIAEPGLDEVFLHFYQEGGADT